MQLPKEHIHQINVQNILTFYWKPLFLAQKSDTSFRSGSRAKTGRFEGLYSYEHVVAGLVRIPNTLVQACLNPERCMMPYCIILLMCRICTTELIWDPVPTPPNPPNTLHQLLASLCASTSPSAFLFYPALANRVFPVQSLPPFWRRVLAISIETI